MTFTRLCSRVLAAFLFLASCASFPTHAAPDPKKVLRVAIEAQDAGFDPVLSSNYYSGMILEAVGEQLLTYDYLARPS